MAVEVGEREGGMYVPFPHPQIAEVGGWTQIAHNHRGLLRGWGQGCWLNLSRGPERVGRGGPESLSPSEAPLSLSETHVRSEAWKTFQLSSIIFSAGRDS